MDTRARDMTGETKCGLVFLLLSALHEMRRERNRDGQEKVSGSRSDPLIQNANKLVYCVSSYPTNGSIKKNWILDYTFHREPVEDKALPVVALLTIT